MFQLNVLFPFQIFCSHQNHWNENYFRLKRIPITKSSSTSELSSLKIWNEAFGEIEILFNNENEPAVMIYVFNLRRVHLKAQPAIKINMNEKVYKQNWIYFPVIVSLSICCTFHSGFCQLFDVSFHSKTSLNFHFGWHKHVEWILSKYRNSSRGIYEI